LRIGADIKRKGKVEKAIKFMEKNKKCSRESRDSIKESLEENETTSRQEKEKSQRKASKETSKLICWSIYY